MIYEDECTMFDRLAPAQACTSSSSAPPALLARVPAWSRGGFSPRLAAATASVASGRIPGTPLHGLAQSRLRTPSLASKRVSALAVKSDEGPFEYE